MSGTSQVVEATVTEDGSLSLLRRILKWDGSYLQVADVSSIAYSIYDELTRSVVSGHNGVSLTPSQVIFDTLQLDKLWTADATGYNFRHTIDVSSAPAFPEADRSYVVEHVITPTSGPPIHLLWRVRVLPKFAS